MEPRDPVLCERGKRKHGRVSNPRASSCRSFQNGYDGHGYSKKLAQGLQRRTTRLECSQQFLFCDHTRRILGAFFITLKDNYVNVTIRAESSVRFLLLLKTIMLSSTTVPFNIIREMMLCLLSSPNEQPHLTRKPREKQMFDNLRLLCTIELV